MNSIYRRMTPVGLYGSTRRTTFYPGDLALLAQFLNDNHPDALVDFEWDGGCVWRNVRLLGQSVSSGGGATIIVDNSVEFPGTRPCGYHVFGVDSITMASDLYYAFVRFRSDLRSKAIRQAQADHSDECSYGKWEAEFLDYGARISVSYKRQRDDAGPRFAHWTYATSKEVMA